MRKITYLAPVESMSGKWTQKSNTTYHNPEDGITGWGSGTNVRFIISQTKRRVYADGSHIKSYFAYRSESNFHIPSSREQTARDLFRTKAAAVREVYATAATLQTYTQQWRASGQHVTLRKYIWDNIPNPNA